MKLPLKIIKRVKVSKTQVKLGFDWKDVNELGRDELAKAMQSSVDAANKRLRRIERADMAGWSPAYRHTMEHGGYFRTGGKDLPALRKELARLQAFFDGVTSSLGGAKAYKKTTENKLVELVGHSDTAPEYIRKFFNILHRAQDLMPDIFIGRNYMPQIQGVIHELAISERFEAMSIEEKAQYLIQELERAEERQRQQLIDMLPFKDEFEF